jgi:hypothetical protein
VPLQLAVAATTTTNKRLFMSITIANKYWDPRFANVAGQMLSRSHLFAQRCRVAKQQGRHGYFTRSERARVTRVWATKRYGIHRLFICVQTIIP